MQAVKQVIKREYLEAVRSKFFLIATIGGPLLLIGMMALPALLVTKGGSETTRCAVLDETGILLAPFAEVAKEDDRLKPYVWTAVEAVPDPVKHYSDRILAGDYDAFLHIPAGVFEGAEASYYAKGLGLAASNIDNLLTRVTTRHRLTQGGLDPDRIESLTKWVSVESFQVSKSGTAEKKDWGDVYLTTMMFVMFLYVTIAVYGASIMNSTVQEKSNRVVEVLLSSTSPFELMLGKLLGVGAVGLTQFLIWSVSGSLLVTFGAATMAASGAELPANLSVATFVWFVIFFVLGFFSMATIYASIGSTCNSPQEATQMAFPAVMPLLASMMISFMIIARPEAPWGIALSFAPFLSPILMFVRIVVQTPPLWQILLAIAINLATILGTIWVASRIYRIGILMYGKRPTLPEVLRWVRAT